MAIDPTAPIAPMIPATPVGEANDPAKAVLALARAAVANTASTLGEIAVGGSHANPDTVKAASGSGATASTASGASGQVEAPPQPVLSTAERMALAVRSAAAQAAPRQAGLAPMMANLDAAIALPETPEPVRQAARAVLDKALPTGRPVTAMALREAVQGSGVFLEARLARAAATPEALVPATETGGDMKAALLVLRAVVSTWLAKAPAVGPESRTFAPKSASEPRSEPARPISAPLPGSYALTPSLDGRTAVYLAASIAPFEGAQEAPAPLTASSQARAQDAGKAATTAAPTPIVEAEAAETPPLEPSETRAGAPPTPAVRSAPSAPLPSLLMVGLIDEEAVDVAPSVLEDEEAALPTLRGAGYAAARPQAPSRPPPPYAGGPTTAQAPTLSDLPRDMPTAELASRLLKDVGGAIARQELSQIASLPEAHHEAERAVETRSSRWVFDLPFQTPQGVAVAQFEISKDGGGGGAEGAREVERTWRARFSLNVEPLGPVHVQIALTGAMTRVGLWAERPEAMARLRAGEEALNAALRQAELTPEVAFHPGVPAVAATTLGHFVDRET